MARFTQEQLLTAYRNAPPAIQDAFGGEVMIGVIDDMKAKYRLHVDTAGNLEREVGYLLLGLVNPTEFFGALVLSGADQQAAKSMMEEINTRIFMPLQRQISGTAPSPIPPMSYANGPQTIHEEPRATAVAVPVLEYAPPVSTLPGSSVPAPMPLSTPAISTLTSAEPFADSVQPSIMPGSRIQNHEVSQIPPVSEPAETIVASTPIKTPSAIPIKKDYGSDPYREPIA